MADIKTRDTPYLEPAAGKQLQRSRIGQLLPRASLTKWFARYRHSLGSAQAWTRVLLPRRDNDVPVNRPWEDVPRQEPDFRTAEPRVPALPVPRPRPLTPPVTGEPPFSTDDQPGSAFFQRLPYDVRRMILVEAFGGQTVHMDLWFNHPHLPRREPPPGTDVSQRGYQTHCARHFSTYSPEHRDTLLTLDESRPKTWRWAGSVCHRVPPRRNYGRTNPRYDWDYVAPAEDLCRYGGGGVDACREWPGEWPAKCFIGVMGWLRSCRRAYAEGVDVLYQTNTIHTASKQMLLFLDTLILPQRLQTVRSVELVWQFDPFPGDERVKSVRPFADVDSFYAFLDALPTTFPHLTSIHLSLQGELMPWVGWTDDARRVRDFLRGARGVAVSDEVVMNPVDDMIRRLGPQLRDCTVALSSDAYMDRRRVALESFRARVEQVHLGDARERHWRPLARGWRKSPGTLEGYWVELGLRQSERFYPWACTMAQGGVGASRPRPESAVAYTPLSLLPETYALRHLA